MLVTSNQLWGGRNKRFDRRVARLYRIGYRLESSDHGSFMVRRGYGWIRSIPYSVLLYCCNREFVDYLAGTLAPSGARRIPYLPLKD